MAEENQNQNLNAAEAADLITKFTEFTSATREAAAFFLESHNFDLDAAVSTFYENNSTAVADVTASANVGDENVDPSDREYSPIRSPSRSRSNTPPAADEGDRNRYNLRDRKSKKSSSSGVRTLADLNRPDEDDEDEDEQRPQEYYTGGQKSGTLVQDPPKGSNGDDLFQQLRQAAEERPVNHHQPSSSSRSFSGRGRLLSGETVPSAAQEPNVLLHTITFWTNGFTVNDGPLRRFDDPDNASFLESIKRSECPAELKPANSNARVEVSLVRRLEDCRVPPKRKNPFQGVGRTLGSTAAEETSVPAPTPVVTAPTPVVTAPTPSMGLVVDQTLPSTSVQLRLLDGTRLVSRFNYHHTINDIRNFIDASRPGGQRSYQLQTMGFPPKQLSDLNQTIEQAGLANSVVIQKL